MKKWQTGLFAVFVVVGLAAGCGGEDPDQDDNQNQQSQNDVGNGDRDAGADVVPGDDVEDDDDAGDDEDVDEFAEDVDVWIGSQVGNEEDPTPLEVGQSFGGRYDVDQGSHHFEIELEAGDVLTIAKVEVEAELGDSMGTLRAGLLDPAYLQGDVSVYRYLAPVEHDAREFFVPESGTYIIDAMAPGGDDHGFIFETDVETATSDGDFEIPGRLEDRDLDDGTVDIFDLVADEEETTSLDLNVTAQRQPVSSQLDAWLYVWDVDSGEVVADSPYLSADVADPQVLFDLASDAAYRVVVDMVANIDDGAYELDAELLDSSPTNPIELDVDDVAEFDGTIGALETEPYVEYFDVAVDPGDYRRFSVEASGELEPGLRVVEQTDGQPGQLPASADVLSVDGEAGVTLGVDEEAVDDPVVFRIELTDQRNVVLGQEELDGYYGGDGFGYTARLEAIDVDATEVSSGILLSVDLESPGALQLFDVDTVDGELVWLDGGTSDRFTEGDDLLELDFVPAWAFFDETTLGATTPDDGYYRGDGSSQSIIYRDLFFRGDADYEADPRIMSFDIDAPDYTDVDLDDGGESIAEATELELPARLSGEFDEIDDQEEPQRRAFDVDIGAGEQLIAGTENDPGMESKLTLYDSGGGEIAGSSKLMEQFQTGDDGENFDDHALVYEVGTTDSYTLVVEQECFEFIDQLSCDTGEVAVSVYVDD